MSQVYQLTPVYPIGEAPDFYDIEYYLLSIHQGCDVRWGYTTDIMVKIDPNEYPNEYVSGTVQYHNEQNQDNINGYHVSNLYDGYRIRHDEHDTLQDQEIDPDRITSLFLFI